MDMDPRKIPTAFLNIIPLSQLPEQSTFDMLFGGKTIEEFAAGYGIDYATVPVGLGWEDDDWGWMDMGDPDALDKTKYQVENPNAIMTPWGPALAPEAVDAIIDDNPGVQSLLGLTSEEIEEIEADADAIIDAGGDNFNIIFEQGNAAAMAENLDPNEVLTGMVDEMANTPSPSDTLFGGQPIDEFAADYGINYAAAEEGFGEEEEDGINLDSGTETPGIDLLDEDRQFLDSLLDLSDSEILSHIDEAMKDWLPAESVTSWVEDHPEWSYMVSTKYNLGQAALTLASGTDYNDLLKMPSAIDPSTPTPTPTPASTDEDGIPFGPGVPSWLAPEKLSMQMRGAFIEALNKQPHPTSKGYTMGGLLTEQQKLDRYNEAKVVFWLDKENFEGSVETIAKEFAAFLNKYWNNPEAHAEYTDKTKLIEKAQLLARYFADPKGMQEGEEDVGDIYPSYADEIFGQEAPYGKANRSILLKLARSGRGFGDHPANRYVDSKMASDERWGKDWAVSFGEMVPNMPTQVVQQPVYSEGPTFAEWVSGGYPASEWPGDSDDATMVDLMTDIPPSDIYYGTGYPFGRPGVTMGMLRPEPVGGTDDWKITPSGRLYNPTMGIWEDKDDFSQRIARGGMVPDDAPGPQDPKASLGQEFYGVGDPVGLPPMILGGQAYPNPASLPPSNISAAEIAAYLAAQEAKMPWKTMPVSKAMYGEAMTQLASAKPGTSYNAYESKKAVKGIPQEQLESMPEPYNDEQRGRRDKGLPYITGRWTGGSKAKWMAKSEAEQAAIRGGDLWVSGTTFVPTKAWGKE